jgi:hypothetical protein
MVEVSQPAAVSGGHGLDSDVVFAGAVGAPREIAEVGDEVGIVRRDEDQIR